MKTTIHKYILISNILLLPLGCNRSDTSHHDHESHNHIRDHEEVAALKNEIHLTQHQYQALGMETDTLVLRNMSAYVEGNGQLEVPPQNEAAVTAVIGANITSIKVIEGDKVSKGQVLAYISHPHLIELQTEYVNHWSQLQYLEQEFKRQEKLYSERVGSGKDFQKTVADYQSMKGLVAGHAAQLKLLGINVEQVKQGKIFEQIAIRSPIDGHIRMVKVKTGQFAEPQKEMFEVVNIDHIHADLMIFEKDMYKVKTGQKVRLSSESFPLQKMEAVIYSVGKAFEQNPKAIHIHAEIENKMGLLIPGMYVRGHILTGQELNYAIPEAGMVRDGEKYYIFTAKEISKNKDSVWSFSPVEVAPGLKDDGWIEVSLLTPLEKGTLVAWNNAYYLQAEMQKGEAEHHH